MNDESLVPLIRMRRNLAFAREVARIRAQTGVEDVTEIMGLPKVDTDKPESITDEQIDAFDQKSREVFEAELREQQKAREADVETEEHMRDMIRQGGEWEPKSSTDVGNLKSTERKK